MANVVRPIPAIRASSAPRAAAAATAKPISRPGPAAAGAGANTENTLAPIIEPSPITTASDVPSRRTKAG